MSKNKTIEYISFDEFVNNTGRAESHRAADDCIMTLEFLNRLEIILNNQ